MPNQAIPYKNINWLRSLKTLGPQGKIDGHLIAALFDDVSNAHGQLQATLTDTQSQLVAALARIAALEKKT